ncbi:MAG: tRNA (adenosine(37)-N6)-threonylcarbamoyltransferase complex ATPase subunit type 1 TsaE [Coriobacteriales bacterium]|jgi:tRNA threonylcarbamoyladenosine biosynthesis protein TsaE|nr:tRNA (adenosine(37)-N6)-threonylcarbamoyltransferase complex ATPase subunit type 1 TsaE [Coriobacteriales bacterium]
MSISGTSAFYSNTPEETVAFGQQLGASFVPGDLVLLVGELGAGKTQLVKGIASALGVSEPITSPTFNLMLEHVGHPDQGNDDILLRHFDLYRLEHPEELEDIDYFGLLEAGDAVSVVEWADRFPDCLPERFIEVRIEWIDERTREISVWRRS